MFLAYDDPERFEQQAAWLIPLGIMLTSGANWLHTGGIEFGLYAGSAGVWAGFLVLAFQKWRSQPGLWQAMIVCYTLLAMFVLTHALGSVAVSIISESRFTALTRSLDALLALVIFWDLGWYLMTVGRENRKLPINLMRKETA